ncbi:MAG TPA: VWA domain-containing protein [Thermodesulfobacteriota bacterium]|nr:VWA domain-containing protein [Thermodesulfobacteriota bacterium]HNU71104.1 VWA domain-containing protein [Thermodesulfobacteriota bacterium]HQO77840.1 VWA domain-containing protein [Thermodesulfobacteriota bacterium]
MTIQYPWTLLLLVLIPVVIYSRRKYISRTGFARVALIGKRLQPGRIKRYGSDIMVGVTILLLVFSIANIQYASYWQRSYLESKWIMLVQDLSGSMQRASGEEEGMTLGDVAIEGARAFIEQRRTSDLIGIVAFSSYAKLIAPPAFDKEILNAKLNLLSRRADTFIFRELAVGGATNASYAVWLALSVFFVLLPEEHQPTYEEISDLRYALTGKTISRVPVPDTLRNINFGQGMAIVLFTDGRIEANSGEEDARRGLLNFANVVGLVKQLGVRLYLIVVGGDVNPEVRMALEGPEGSSTAGDIFYMPHTFNQQKIEEVYDTINRLEQNRLLVKMERRKKDTRWIFAAGALSIMAAYCLVQVIPYFRKI